MSTPVNASFLQACRGEAVPRTPVWLMRQAGRYMPEYRALRARQSILDLIKSPEHAAEITLQPVRAFDLDAAIIFADILTLPEAMGMPLAFHSGQGPVFSQPLREAADVRSLRSIDPHRDLAFTLDAIRLSLEQLQNRIPLIGFSGAPFTLACYAIQGSGSKDFDLVRAWMRQHPQAWHELMSRLSEAVSAYLIAQLDAGVHAVQLFDSWAGSLSAADYAEWVQPYTAAIFRDLSAHSSAPRIHFSANGGHLLQAFVETGCTVLGLDWRVDAAAAIRTFGTRVAYQGNLDPAALLAGPDVLQEQIRRTLSAFSEAKGYVFNLGHGVVKTTDPEQVRLLVDTVHALPRRGAQS